MKSTYQTVRAYTKQINWQLLAFLVLFLNVKVFIKIGILVLFILLNRKAFLNRESYKPSYTWFYISLIGISFINFFMHFSNEGASYLFTFFTGILFWLMCLAAGLLILQFCKTIGHDKLHSTISLFFILNVAATLLTLLIIMIDSGAFNPYTYQGMYQKYFISTGDRMKGITFDVSTTNAFINSFGIIYFIYRKKAAFALSCMFALLLTASNITNFLLVIVLLYMFIFKSTRLQKSLIVVFFLMLATFMIKISPQNNEYVFHIITEQFGLASNPLKKGRPSSVDKEKQDPLLNEEKRKKMYAKFYVDSTRMQWAGVLYKDEKNNTVSPKPARPKADIHSASHQRIRDTTALQKKLLQFAMGNLDKFNTASADILAKKYPGKFIAAKQTFQYLSDNPKKILTGNGMANFSSKLAFRATGFGVSGEYPGRFTYINDDFKNNHLGLFLSYYTKNKDQHSIINTPNSVYIQLISEYGLAGILAFIFLYVMFFIKTINRSGYGLPLLLLMLAGFAIEYWFELISIVVLFELLMHADKSSDNFQKPQREGHIS